MTIDLMINQPISDGVVRWALYYARGQESSVICATMTIRSAPSVRRMNMSKVFVNIGLSLDGYMAPEGMTLEHWDDPGYKDWGAKWGALMGWIFNQQYFRENLKLGPGGETGPSMTCFGTPRSASASTSWASGCSRRRA